jgi:hypothetical protein
MADSISHNTDSLVTRHSSLITPRSVRSINWIGLTLLFLALSAALPIWTGPGILNTRGGGDSPFLFIRLHQLVANLHDGVFPARWMPDAAYGLGYPFFNYYAALPYYFGALFNLLGFDVLISIKLVQTLGFVFATFAMYRWADRHFNARSVSWLIAVAYLAAPFHFVNVYVRGDSLSEFYAFVFYPLILLAIDQVLESPRSFYKLAFAYGDLILTHNVSALIFSPFALLYAILCILKSEITLRTVIASEAKQSQRQAGEIASSAYGLLAMTPEVRKVRSKIQNLKSKILGLSLGFLFAFALSAWFWLPALSESNLVQLDVQTTGYFNYSGHFRSFDLVQPSLGFDYAITTTPGSNTPFAMGLAQVLATLLGLIGMALTWRSACDKPWRVFALIGLALSTFMITPWSQALWDHLPLLPFTQFPWRFLSIQAVFTSMIIGYSVQRLGHRSSVICRLLIGLLLFTSVWLSLKPDYLSIRADEITAQRIQLYESFTTNIGTTIRGEYLPKAVVPHPLIGQMLLSPFAPQAIVSSGQATADQSSRASTKQTWRVRVESDRAVIDFPLLYWPGWMASIDGQVVEAKVAPDLGYIQVEVPNGEHRIELVLGNTPIRSAAEIISLISLIGLLAWISAQLLHQRQTRPARLSDQSTLERRLWRALAVLLIFIFGYLLMGESYPDIFPSDLTMDFAQRPWLHRNPGGVDFGNGIKLLAYAINGDLLSHYTTVETSDQSITVSLNWSVSITQEVSATIALVAPSTPPFETPNVIDQQVLSIQSGQSKVRLMPPYPLSTGLYYIRIRVGSIDQYLKPIEVRNERTTVDSHPFGKLTPAIGLSAVQAQYLDQDHLDVLLSWSVSGSIDANYGIALRLNDATGKLWQSIDTQPGYGYRPTSAWSYQPCEGFREDCQSFNPTFARLINDAYTFALPQDLPRDGLYSLDAILYRIASKEEVGRTTIENISLGSTYTWRSIEPPPRDLVEKPVPIRVDAIFGDQIELLGYDLARTDTTLIFTPTWKAVMPIDANYKVFVHVFDPLTEKVVAQSDAMPHHNTYATSRWVVGEVVSDTIEIPLSDIPPGSYRIAVGVYLPPNDRLPIGGDRNVDAVNRRVILDEVIDVP